MKKEVLFHYQALKEFKDAPKVVQKKMRSHINALSIKGFLEPPSGKKIDKDLFEIRIRVQGAWRSLYSYINKDKIIILTFTNKKANKLSNSEIQKAKIRLNDFKR